jgi:hypothetical protein
MAKSEAAQAGKFLSESLRQLAMEQHDIDGSDVLTRAQCLAKTVWEHALGHSYQERTSEGEMRVKKVRPQKWAIELILDRLEGRVSSTGDEANKSVSLTDRVEQINKENFKFDSNNTKP